MSSINLVILSGHLGQDAKINVTAGGQTKVWFSLATTIRFKSKKTDQWEDRTTWHDVIMWGDMAAKLHRELTKGTLLTVEGELDKRSYDKEGEKRYVVEVRAKTIVLHSKARAESRAAKSEAEIDAQSPDDGEIPF